MAENVFRLPLPLPDTGLRAVNAYVLLGGAGPVVVDPGQATGECWDALVAGLLELGLRPHEVTRVLVTHIHRDHYTQSVVLRRRHGTRIALGEGEKVSLTLVRDRFRERMLTQLRLLQASGAPDIAAAMADNDDGVDIDLWEEPDEWLPGWAYIPLGDRALTAIPTPGHTRGHVVFHDAAARLLFAGDHVLPAITPSIGFEPGPGPLPLADYLHSLLLMRRIDDCALLPAHGPVTGSLHDRVTELLEHHADRLEATYAGLSVGVDTAAEVARRLLWTRWGRSFDDLSAFDRMLAVLETRAHLDVLVDRDRLVVHRDEAGVDRYATA
ncbi:MAG: MBL fold metallo-hydrolase [Actinomycetota bacterium]|nr:MBL fold metallo-hydrolase [Actinomycetota bacterium]